MERCFEPQGIGVVLLTTALTITSLASCQAGREGVQPSREARAARQGLDESGQMRLSSDDRCPVCAMSVAEHGRFASAIELDDRRAFYFCGTGCMMRAWLHPEVYLGTSRQRLRRAVVREYFAGEHLDASAITFVAGSDVVGPMGPALVPVKNAADLETFRERHGAETTFRLEELTDARFEAVTGKRPLPQGRRR